jgi:putative ABC transport system permease protein
MTFRFALRRIQRRPIHSLVVALTLGLGLGAALAVFTVVDAVLLRPLPYEHADRLVRLGQVIPVARMPELGFSDVGFRRLVAEARTLDAIAAYDTRDANLVGDGTPQRLTMAQVSASMFDVLGVRPTLGRGFTDTEDLPNAPRVMLLADWLWRSAFGTDPSIVGRAVNIDGEPFTVVGVLPASTAFPSRQIAGWEPLRMDPTGVNPYGRNWPVVARMNPAATMEQVRNDIVRPIRAVGREYPGPHSGSALDMAGYQARVRWLGDDVVGDTRPVVVLLLGGVTLLLLLTCANVANLQLASAIARREELAVRGAMGATRARLATEALVEGLLLTVAGAIVGTLVALFAQRVLQTLLPTGVPSDAGTLSLRALGATIALVLAVGAVVGVAPVLLGARRQFAGALRERSHHASQRVRRLLAATQVALAVMLLHGAGLLVASARAAQNVRLGFRPDSILTLRVNLTAEQLRDRSTRETLLRRVLAELGRLPGTRVAALANALPLERGRRDLAMALEGRPFRADGTDPLADYRVVSHGYFEAMGIRVVRGRTFTDDDATDRYTPIVISEALAKEIWGDDTDPIGHRLRFAPNAPWMPIIGVVTDAVNRSLTEPPRPELYVPALGSYATNLALRTEITLLVRGSTGVSNLIGPMRRVVAEVDPGLPMFEIATMAEVVRRSRGRMTSGTTLMTAYAIAALLLAAAGTYAVLSYLVTQRDRELAIRLALGATPRAVVELVARESALIVGAGLVLGLASAVALSRLLAGMLFGVAALEPTVVAGVVAVAAVAGVVAALLPARRAAGVDPSATLRDAA